MEEEKELKTKNHFNKTVEVKKYDTKNRTGGVTVRLKKNSNIIEKILLDLSTPQIIVTWKPKKLVEKSSVDNGLVIQESEETPYSIEEFKKKYSEYVELAKQTLKKDITIVLSYTEKEFFNDKEKEVETYFFMQNYQAEQIYVPEIMDKDKKMQKRKEWQEERAKPKEENLAKN